MGRRGFMLLAVALLVGSAAAFTRTEKLKLAPPPVGKPHFVHRFAPACGCAKAKAHLSFLLRRAQRLDISIVDADGGHVATIGENLDRSAGRVRFLWDGRDDRHGIVPEGNYRVRVHLDRDRRTILVPAKVTVDTTPPRVLLVGVRRTTSVAGASSADRLDVRYRSNEAGRAFLRVDGKVVLRGESRRPGTWRLQWQGPTVPRRSAAQAHEVTLVVVDDAGNRSRPTRPVVVQGS